MKELSMSFSTKAYHFKTSNQSTNQLIESPPRLIYSASIINIKKIIILFKIHTNLLRIYMSIFNHDLMYLFSETQELCLY